jgi:hypothetical protein
MLLQATYFSTINSQFVGLPTHIYVPPGEKPGVTGGLPMYGVGMEKLLDEGENRIRLHRSKTSHIFHCAMVVAMN